MFPPELLPTVFEKKSHRVLIIDNSTTIDSKLVIKELSLQLLKEKFEVVLLTDKEEGLSDICQQNQEWCRTNESENNFTYYLSSWLKLEYVLRIHKIESIIRVSDISDPYENLEKFKFANKFGVTNFIMSINIRDNQIDDNENLDDGDDDGYSDDGDDGYSDDGDDDGYSDDCDDGDDDCEDDEYEKLREKLVILKFNLLTDRIKDVVDSHIDKLE
ncbi:MAG: hypothetical protein ACRDAQ_00800 [Cetobacterium sp.]